ncbi:MAG TPA: isoprenylcysteine carboxylmethyltransferase family protein [Gammaproteobacteria bacterium]|nr:isoprenylcysteine carboxylmethyltransferase family protein [Gammaproteobacteria bacterium]
MSSNPACNKAPRHPAPLVRCGQVLFRYRNIIFPLMLLILMIWRQPNALAGNAAADIWLDAAGLAIIVAGLVLRGWVIGLQYIKRGGENNQVYAEGLVTGGVFSCSRNPLYVGNVLLLIGLTVIFNDAIVYAVAIPVALFAYEAIVAAEEHFLAGKFGQAYADYCATVNRWFPNPRRLVAATRGERFDWPRVIGADYNTAWTWLTAAVLVLIYERASAPGWQAVEADLTPLWASLAVLAAAYIVAWVMKKKGLLGKR